MSTSSTDKQNMNKQKRRVRQAKRRLGVRTPFFGALIHSAKVRLLPENAESSESGKSWSGAVTDGETIYLRPKFAERLSDPELEGLLLHGLVHMAWLHAPRRKHREVARWNVAVDILANAAVAEVEGPELLAGAVRAPELEDRCVEAIYSILGEKAPENLSFHGREEPEDYLPGVHLLEEHAGGVELRQKWRSALFRARSIAGRARGQGELPAGLKRDFNASHQGSQIDWRSALWRWVSKARSDYSGIDRRKVHRGRYVQELTVKRLHVRICVDTSGSISQEELGAFIGEVRAIVRSHDRVDAKIWYCDAALSGPYDLNSSLELPAPEGGGGTDFRPFFEALSEEESLQSGTLAVVYLTDGYGSWPSGDLRRPVLWAVPVGGRPADEFPFGRVVRLEV